MLKRVLLYVFVLFLIVITWALMNAKPFAIKQIEQALKKHALASSVSIGSLKYSLMGPVTVEKLRIKRKNGETWDIDMVMLDQGLGAIWGTRTGTAWARQITLGKITLKHVQIRVWWLKDKMRIDIEQAMFLQGRIKGYALVQLDRPPRYEVRLDIQNMSMAQAVNEYKLKEKVLVTGLLGGALMVKGTGKKLDQVEGNLISQGPGGQLTIVDTRYLEQMAKNTGQAQDLLVDSFKYYIYNNGLVRTELKAGNLDMNVVLDGENGKRDLTVVVHDFNLERLGL